MCWHIISDEIDNDKFPEHGIPVHKSQNSKLTNDMIGEQIEFEIQQTTIYFETYMWGDDQYSSEPKTYDCAIIR